ncbi:MAG: hypothetical protein DCC68_25415 [Planctomycetota bacterium]|nr:MAG: hypothetical protein DCC68_25415 [Planctomycetota bacterium]
MADRLLESAEQLEIRLVRRDNGNVTACIELHASLGADLFTDDDDTDDDEQARKSYQGLADVRTLLAAFAAAGKDGDA